jgi:hypothetical protein
MRPTPDSRPGLPPGRRGRLAHLGSCAAIGLLMAPLLVAAGCEPRSPQQEQTGAGPRIRATVLTIRATIRPQNKAFVYWLAIADDRARLGSEVDQWRLFDFQKQTVTFVDDLARTYRTVDMPSLVAAYRSSASTALPDGIPLAEYVATEQQRTICGITATLSIVRMGGYERELWMAEAKAIPPELFPLMLASQPSDSLLRGAMRDVAPALLQLRGFPLADRARLTYGNTQMSVDREVVRIEAKDVPASWLNIDRDYRETVARPVAPPTTPVVRPPGAESPPGDRKTPAGESPPSSTDQKAP